MRAKPTILDIARHAEVSVGTVSNVLNDTRTVAEAKRDRVLAAVEALGYVPNVMAQGLRRQRSRVVGLCVPHGSSAYFTALIEAFEEIAAREGFEIMQVLSHNDPALELRRVRALFGHRIAGLIMMPSIDPGAAFGLIGDSGVPTVVVDRPWHDGRFDYVTMDNHAAMLAAAGHLTALGHRKALFIMDFPGLVTTRRRIETFREVMAAGGNGAILQRAEDWNRFVAEIKAALESATAVIASNSAVALWTVKALQELGLEIPGRVSLLAFDEPDWAEILTPRLSLMRHPTRDMARMAWELLIRRMREPATPTRHVEFQAELVPGGTTAAPKRAPGG